MTARASRTARGKGAGGAKGAGRGKGAKEPKGAGSAVARTRRGSPRPVPAPLPVFARLDATTLPLALKALAARDPAFARALARCGPPPLRFSRPGFASLAGILLGQQVSRASARAVRAKLVAQTGGRLTAKRVLGLSPAALRSAGLSRQKAEYILVLAEAWESGALPHRRFAAMSDEEVADALTALKGFGPWSAENYLLFALARPDILPAADLGLWGGLQKMDGLASRPGEAALRARGEEWRPLRSAAALMLWHCRDA